jgi:hypothetical protein
VIPSGEFSDATLAITSRRDERRAQAGQGPVVRGDAWVKECAQIGRRFHWRTGPAVLIIFLSIWAVLIVTLTLADLGRVALTLVDLYSGPGSPAMNRATAVRAASPSLRPMSKARRISSGLA